MTAERSDSDPHNDGGDGSVPERERRPPQECPRQVLDRGRRRGIRLPGSKRILQIGQMEGRIRRGLRRCNPPQELLRQVPHSVQPAVPPRLLGMTGHKVVQTLPKRLDSSLEWEPIKDHGAVKLKTRYGHFLRANGGLPPWRNSVTHDVPHRTATQDWVLWQVHVVDILVVQSQSLGNQDSVAAESDAPTASQSSKSPSFYRQESIDSLPPKANEGRLVYFRVVNEAGEVDEEFEELCIKFKGTEVHELTRRLEVELGTKGLTVCSRSPLNGKLCPLRLQLPPHNATMHVVVIPPSSKADRDSENAGDEQ